ncbi:hypothetical protein CR513_17508, partial [Mucuna pruriens]
MNNWWASRESSWTFVVVADTSYNVLIDRLTLNALGAIVSTPYLVMKFPSSNGRVATKPFKEGKANIKNLTDVELDPSPTPKLKAAKFIQEFSYTTWLSNVVLVKKHNKKWRMCVDYFDLNKACPKDSYPLLSINRLINGTSTFQERKATYQRLMDKVFVDHIRHNLEVYMDAMLSNPLVPRNISKT